MILERRRQAPAGLGAVLPRFVGRVSGLSRLKLLQHKPSHSLRVLGSEDRWHRRGQPKTSSPDRLARLPRPGTPARRLRRRATKWGESRSRPPAACFGSRHLRRAASARRPTVAAPLEHQPLPAASAGPIPQQSTPAPGPRARPFGFTGLPGPLHHFAVIPRIAPGVPVSVVSRHVSRATGRWDYRSPVGRVRLSCARRCAPPVRATGLPIPTWVTNTQARNCDAF